MRINLLLTGHELMTGDTLDSNSAMIAQLCFDQGIQVAVKSTIPDDMPLLVSEIERLSQGAQVLIVNGGLGPTSDDMTAEALTKVVGRPLAIHPDAMAHLQAWSVKRNYPLSEANNKQAFLPKDIDLVANESGSAVGFKIKHNGCLIICTPGVPHELKTMLVKEILPELSLMLPDNIQPKRVRYRIFGYGESNLQQAIHEQYPDWPEQIELGFRASMPLLELKLKVDRKQDHILLDQWKAKIEGLLGAHIVTQDDRSLAEVVVNLLAERSLKVTCVESCTGGRIASMITEVSGSSHVFEAGFVTYANHIKTSVVGVTEEILNSYGAVSEPVVKQMLIGALKASNADLGVAVSGIAGPSGGSDDKPVGTVWLAWGSKEKVQAHQFYFPGNRLFFQKIVSALALDLLRRELLDIDEEADYFQTRRYRSKS
jgi:nicotinamide-nucleotide amidase